MYHTRPPLRGLCSQWQSFGRPSNNHPPVRFPCRQSYGVMDWEGVLSESACCQNKSIVRKKRIWYWQGSRCGLENVCCQCVVSGRNSDENVCQRSWCQRSVRSSSVSKIMSECKCWYLLGRFNAMAANSPMSSQAINGRGWPAGSMRNWNTPCLRALFSPKAASRPAWKQVITIKNSTIRNNT